MRDRPAAVDHHAGTAIQQFGRILPRTGHGGGASPLPRTESSHRGLRQTRPGSIEHRVALGRLHPVHRAVYAVGHTVLTRSGRWMAAVLACGPGAALSHASAAALWGLQRGEPNIIDVTARRTGRKRPGIRIHRPRVPAETTTHDAIRVTTPARTILDLAATVTRSRLEHLLDQAEIRELTDYPSLDGLARAHPGHHGATRLTAPQLLRRHRPQAQRPRDPLPP